MLGFYVKRKGVSLSCAPSKFSARLRASTLIIPGRFKITKKNVGENVNKNKHIIERCKNGDRGQIFKLNEFFEKLIYVSFIGNNYHSIFVSLNLHSSWATHTCMTHTSRQK